jgi:hypothetical protein
MRYPDFLVDKRVVARNIAKGLLDGAEVEKQIAALPDVGAKVDTSAPEPDDSLDLDDEDDEDDED